MDTLYEGVEKLVFIEGMSLKKLSNLIIEDIYLWNLNKMYYNVNNIYRLKLT